ncbi:MAG: hypothetical protein IVW57_13915 [Ktedonobacterales bacterium]|nr:hypothetical protein [Ktedonobacterales bacterium]
MRRRRWGGTLFAATRGFDAVGNVTSTQMTLPGGTDTQAFCYDEQDRLTWAGSTGTPACGTPLTPGTLTSAAYTQAFSYDTSDRLVTGPLGSYSYGTRPVHAVTSTSTGYGAQ